MDLRRQTNGQCRMNDIEARGDANLCCCYIIDENGKYDDPCYYPADTCCSNGVQIAEEEKIGGDHHDHIIAKGA